MSKWLVCALVIGVGGCGNKNVSPDSGVGDMAMPGGGDLSVGDMAMPTTGGKMDMAHGPDMDNHVPLRLPPTAVPLTVDGGVDYYEMHVKETQQQVLPGNKTTIWGFEGQWPGPTIRATMGRAVTLRVFNDLPVNEPITIHNHGHNSLPAFDGHPTFNAIPQNTHYDYHYPNMQMGGTAPNYQGAGTYFFHDHAALLTGPHIYKGIAAFYIIDPAPTSTEAGLGLPSGQFDVPLMVQDRTFDASNQLVYNVQFIQGLQGQTLVVNGTPHPFMTVSRRKYRFRILNGSNARRIAVGLSAGQMIQIATDGGLMPQQLSTSTVPLAPAERAEIVIDFKQYKIGDVVTMTNTDAFSPTQPEILQFRVTSDATDTSTVPVTLNSLYTAYNASTPVDTRGAGADTTRTLTIAYDGTNSQWQMNGHIYDMNAFEWSNTKLGDVETWTLTNNDNVVPHPFHQHLVQFQILSICPNATPNCGVGPPATAQGWKDTVLVPAASTVKIKMSFYWSGGGNVNTLFPAAGCVGATCQQGAYVFHCHNLEHEDHQMMLQQVVNHP